MLKNIAETLRNLGTPKPKPNEVPIGTPQWGDTNHSADPPEFVPLNKKWHKVPKPKNP